MISRSSPDDQLRDQGASGRRARLERHADRLVPHPLQAHREQVLYLVVGAWNTLAGYGAFAILYFLLGGGVSYAVIIVASYVVAITNAYLGYRYVAFRSHASILREFPRFSTVYVATLVVNLVFFPVALAHPAGRGLRRAGGVHCRGGDRKLPGPQALQLPAAVLRWPRLGAPGAERSAASQEAGLDGPVSGGE